MTSNYSIKFSRDQIDSIHNDIRYPTDFFVDLFFDNEKEAKLLGSEIGKIVGREIKVVQNKRSSGGNGYASFAEVDKKAKEMMNADFRNTGLKQEQFKDWALEGVQWGKGIQSRYYKYYALALRDSGYKNWPQISVDRNFDKSNTTASGTKFALATVNGQKESAYIKEAAKDRVTKGYGTESISKKEAEEAIDRLLSELDSGNLSEQLKDLLLELIGLKTGGENLKTSIDENTKAQDKASAQQEMATINDKLFDALAAKGLLGEELKQNQDNKAFADMSPYSPLRSKINSWNQDALLEWGGMDRNTDYKAYRKRRVGYMMDLSGGIDKNGNGFLDLDEKAKKLRADDETHNAMKAYLTNGPGKRFSKELYNKMDDNTKKQLGLEGNFKEFQSKLKGMDNESLDNVFDKFKGGETEIKGMKTSLEDVVTNMQEFTENTLLAQDRLRDLGNTIKDEIAGGAMNALNTGFTKAGDLAYKLQNNLIEGADATMEMKKALAGVAATMLENIGASMTQTGLSIAGGAAQDRNWGMVAAGLALAVAGGAASFGGGMLSAFASDNNKGDSIEAEDQLARLEDLKDNLAELLKQAKDDAIYYETNLRQKQAVAFNDAVSSTNVNDAIITPRGVVNTAPDDYIMAMKDPTHLLGKGGGGTNVSFSIVNESGTPMTVTSSETRQNGDTTEITAIVNAIVQKSMNDGEYDDVMAGMQVRQRGSQISS